MHKLHENAIAKGDIHQTAAARGGVYKDAVGNGYHDAHGNAIPADEAEEALSSLEEARDEAERRDDDARNPEPARYRRERLARERAAREESDDLASRREPGKAGSRTGRAGVPANAAEAGGAQAGAPDGAPEKTDGSGAPVSPSTPTPPSTPSKK